MRQFSPYEYNQLVKHGINPDSIHESNTAPVEYITGFVEFAGREWHITPEALIPRIETEELLAHALETAEKLRSNTSDTKPLRWIEVGTGSGALGLSFWLELQKRGIPNTGVLSDISGEALNVTRKNASAVKANLPIIESDLFNAIDPDLQFDLILTNLPYIPTERIAYLDESVKDHEPEVALDGGSDGLYLIKKLITQLPNRLHTGGSAWLEIDYTHTQQELSQDPTLEKPLSYLEVTSVFDQFEKQRFWKITRK